VQADQQQCRPLIQAGRARPRPRRDTPRATFLGFFGLPIKVPDSLLFFRDALIAQQVPPNAVTADACRARQPFGDYGGGSKHRPKVVCIYFLSLLGPQNGELFRDQKVFGRFRQDTDRAIDGAAFDSRRARQSIAATTAAATAAILTVRKLGRWSTARKMRALKTA
jgi:hypothetical protein